MAYKKSTPEWKEFLRFLEERGVKAAFIHNMIVYKRVWKRNRWEESFTDIHKSVSPCLYVHYGFPWRKTTEGSSFWAKIDAAWRVRLRYLRVVNYLN